METGSSSDRCADTAVAAQRRVGTGPAPRRDRFAESVAVAARLVWFGDGISSMHVVAGRRPTYAELRTARLEAERWGLTVGVAAGGGVVLRRPAETRAVAPAPPARPSPAGHPPDGQTVAGAGSSPGRPSSEGRVMAGARRLLSEMRAWGAGFAGIREGTR